MLVLGMALSGCSSGQPAATASKAASTSASAPASNKNDHPTLRVMTFNLRTAAAKDSHPWTKRWLAAKELINKEKPDVIGTQEGIRSQLDELQFGTPGYKWVGVGREKGGSGEFTAVFYNVERLKPIRNDSFWLSDTPDVPGSQSWGSEYPRMVTKVLFEDLKTGGKLYVLNTHFDNASETARQHSAEQVAAEIGKLEPAIPVILTGDFNTIIGSPPYKHLLSAGGLKDAVQEAKEKVNAGIATFHNYAGGGGRTHIDWILYRGQLDVLRSEKVMFQLNGEYPSDHYPVMVDVAVQAAVK
jgi:endonuclease/exonuclease/phosphatase family metal-dependent hydrolase